ncbi:hypothetical protein FNB15_18245 [Ferrovibrio terrae]|uniref:MerR family transcriptional regulator n=1 Tax=Ferrovibrio terrae TaxID=2594003 RepID=A0A516H5Y0_9PROT|nr:hypothetical protein [Ferrovibrio terrae]QDO99090.1 hypothetical protein FNB15_18245 [Ferrovibrio terrae]
MTEPADTNLRFAVAAYAAGVTAKSLRHWIDAGLELPDGPPDSGHWRHSYRNVAVIALTAAIAGAGPSVSDANRLALAGIMRATRPAPSEADARGGQLVAAWRHHRLQVSHEIEGAPSLRRVELRRSYSEWRNLSAPEFYEQVRREIEPASVFVQIDVAAVLEAAFARADEALKIARLTDDSVDEFAADFVGELTAQLQAGAAMRATTEA